MIIINILLVLFILITIILIIDQNNKDNKNIDKKFLKISKTSLLNPDVSIPTIAGGSPECGYKGVLNPDGLCNCGATNSLGDKCQYNNKTTCNGRGDVTDKGYCNCYTTFKGENCQYSNYDTCSNRGKVDSGGNCICVPGFGGLSCEQAIVAQPGQTLATFCPKNFEGQPDCQSNANAKYCNGNGIYKIIKDPNTGDESYVCDCTIDWVSKKQYKGNDCRYLDRIDCNSYGRVDNNGYCTCDDPSVRGGPACLSCGTGRAGSVNDTEPCKYTDATTCRGKGKAQNDGSCKCDIGYNGPNCQYGNEECSLGPGKGRGIVDMNGKCTCIKGEYGNAMGKNCEFTDLYTCNGNGYLITEAPKDSNPTPIPYCKCFPLFKSTDGKFCNTCKDQFIGNYCNYFKDNARFVNADNTLVINFSSPGLIVIAKKRDTSSISSSTSSTSSPSISNAFQLKEDFDIFYSGYYINKDGTLFTELFFANENNEIKTITNLVFKIVLINNLGSGDISSINQITAIDVIFCNRNLPSYPSIRCNKY
jgi:hypothetical protein